MDKSGGSIPASGRSARRGRAGGLYYGWVIVGVSFISMAFHMAATFSFSLFQVPLIQEFGWSRGALGGAFATTMSLYAICSPKAGSILERKGPRTLIPWGSVSIGLGLMLGFFISSLWHVYVFIGVMIGVGIAMSGFVTHGALLRGGSSEIVDCGGHRPLGHRHRLIHSDAHHRKTHRLLRLALRLPDFRRLDTSHHPSAQIAPAQKSSLRRRAEHRRRFGRRKPPGFQNHLPPTPRK